MAASVACVALSQPVTIVVAGWPSGRLARGLLWFRSRHGEGRNIAQYGLIATIAVGLLAALLTGLTGAAGLSQIGELSFILAEMRRSRSLLSEDGVNMVLAAALVTITLNPLLFRLIESVTQRFAPDSELAPARDRPVRNPI